MSRWIGLLVALLLGGAILYGTFAAGSGVTCRACVDYEGRSHCAEATATTREEAERGAWSTACAAVARGVTKSLECQRQPLRSLSCSE